MVEYTLLENNKQFESKYKTMLPSKEVIHLIEQKDFKSA
jgi:hypothetical protein